MRDSGDAGPGGPAVYKFGGSSVADAACIRSVAELVAAAPMPVVVVVSAVTGATNRLATVARERAAGRPVAEAVQALRADHKAIARELLDDAPSLLAGVAAEIDALHAGLRGESDTPPGSAEDGDRIRAVGEGVSSRLLAAALARIGHPVERVDACDLIHTDARFGGAEPETERIAEAVRARVLPHLSAGRTVVTEGFVGRAPDGRTTTLGRGGSDLTATLLGAALGAREVHIWTDVAGVFSGDPRVVDRPRLLDRIGFDEVVELATFGAKVLHPGAAKYAVSRGVAVRIRSTFEPGKSGTVVLRQRQAPAGIAAIAHRSGVALVQVRSHPSAIPYGFLARVFEVLTRHKLPVDLVATSHTSTAFTLDATAEVALASAELAAFAEVAVRTGLATVTVVGHGLLQTPGVVAQVFAEVASTPVHLVSQATDVSLSLVVDEDDARPLVRRLHDALIPPLPAAESR